MESMLQDVFGDLFYAQYWVTWKGAKETHKFRSCIVYVESSPLFVQLMHTNYYKTVKQLKSFKIIIIAPTCFGLHKPSSGSSQPVLR